MALWARQADTPAAQGLSLLLASILLLFADLPPSRLILALSHTHPPPRGICLRLPNCPSRFFTPMHQFLAFFNYFSFFHYLKCGSRIFPEVPDTLRRQWAIRRLWASVASCHPYFLWGWLSSPLIGFYQWPFGWFSTLKQCRQQSVTDLSDRLFSIINVWF